MSKSPICRPWLPVVWMVAIAVCCVWAWPAWAQDDLAQRIASQRDRAAEQVPHAEHASEPPAPRTQDAGTPTALPGSTTDAAPDPADEELSTIPPAVNPEELLPLGPSEADAGDRAAARREASGAGWVMNTIVALGVVIALIFVVRWIARRAGVGGGVRVTSSPIVEVLSRTTVAPRNHVVLLRVGSRILVVNDGTSGMRTLATIEDPEEIAGLLQSVQAEAESSMSNSFGKVMSKLSGQWSAAEVAEELGGDDSEAGVDRARGALAGLRSRLALASDTRGGGGA
ncbi:MAG: FliO/MopB family protein [Phycisphaerales bacterium JB063]